VAAVLLASMASTPKEVSIFMVRHHHLSRLAPVFMSIYNSIQVPPCCAYRVLRAFYPTGSVPATAPVYDPPSPRTTCSGQQAAPSLSRHKDQQHQPRSLHLPLLSPTRYALFLMCNRTNRSALGRPASGYTSAERTIAGLVLSIPSSSLPF
jgi:hypothetical protein